MSDTTSLADRPQVTSRGGSHNTEMLMYFPWTAKTFLSIIERFHIHGSVAKMINRGEPLFSRTNNVPMGPKGELAIGKLKFWQNKTIFLFTCFINFATCFKNLYHLTLMRSLQPPNLPPLGPRPRVEHDVLSLPPRSLCCHVWMYRQ